MNELMCLLENDDARKILVATYISPRSAIELSFRLGISITKCYTLIRKLEVHGLLRPDRASANPRGRPARTYRASLRNAQMVMENDRMQIQFELPENFRSTPFLEVMT